MAGNEVKLTVTGDADKAERELEGFRQSMDRVAKKARTMGLVLAAAGAGGILAIKSFAGAALEQEKAMRTLLAVSGVAADQQGELQEEIERTTAALQAKTNFGDEEQLRVLARMVPALGSVEKAMEALPAVLDAASASGLDVNSVAGTLSRALAGLANTSESTGLSFDETADFAERLALVTAKVGGAAEANADPFAQLGNTLGDIKEVIGQGLLPTLTPLLEAFRDGAEKVKAFMEENQTLVRVLGGLAIALTAMAVVGGPLLLFLSFLPAMITGLKLLATGFNTARLAALRFALPILVVVAAFDLMERGLNQLNRGIDKLTGQQNEYKTSLERVLESIGGWVSKLDASFDSSVKAAEGTGDLAEQTDEFTRAMEQAQVALDGAPSRFDGLAAGVERTHVAIGKMTAQFRFFSASINEFGTATVPGAVQAYREMVAAQEEVIQGHEGLNAVLGLGGPNIGALEPGGSRDSLLSGGERIRGATTYQRSVEVARNLEGAGLGNEHTRLIILQVDGQTLAQVVDGPTGDQARLDEQVRGS